MKCKGCDKEIPQKRIELGFKKCVNCSDTEKYGVVDVVYHKTGNTVEITDAKTAEAVNKAAKRSGYGVMRGMTKGGSKMSSTYNPKGKSKNTNCVSTSFVGTTVSFNKIGEKAMLFFEVAGIDAAYEVIEKAFKEMEINIYQRNKLRQVFENLM
jgi:hypothetical protein